MKMDSPKKDCISSFPDWVKGLENAENLEEKWITGIVRLQQEVDDIIDEYCMSLPCDFVKRYPSNMSQKHLKNSETSRILWQMKDIPFSGIPFSVVSHDVLTCTFSQNLDTKKKRKVTSCDESKEIIVPLDKVTKDKEEGTSTSKCLTNIVVKKIIRFSSFSVPFNASKHEKLFTLKQLKEKSANENLEGETVFWLRIPLSTLHNHSFRGSDRVIHRSLRLKIREYISGGVTSPQFIKSLLNTYVKEKFKDNNNPPLLDDQAYYPDTRKIRNFIYNATSRNNPKSISREENGCENLDVVTRVECPPPTILGKKSSSLTDIVQEFCSDSIDDDDGTKESNVKTLQEQILEKLNQLIEITQSLNDPKKLRELLNLLNSFPSHNKEQYSVQTNNLCSAFELNPKESFPLDEVLSSDPPCYVQVQPQIIQIGECSQIFPLINNIDSQV